MRTNLSAVARDVKKIYFDTDVKMKSVPKVCRKACSYCCHQNVRVHYGEGPLIERYIAEELTDEVRSRIREQLIRWFAYFDENTPSGRPIDEHDMLEFEAKITKDRVPCAFLIDDRCAIYKVRPLVCRTHSVNDDPKLCEDDPHRNGDPKGIEIQKKQISAIGKAADVMGVRPLAYAVQEVLGVNHRCKPISLTMLMSMRRNA